MTQVAGDPGGVRPRLLATQVAPFIFFFLNFSSLAVVVVFFVRIGVVAMVLFVVKARRCKV